MSTNAYLTVRSLFGANQSCAVESAAAIEALESLSDLFGLGPTISFLADMCHEKAEHLRANWQDDPTAKQWEAAAMKLDKLGAQISL